MSAEPLRLYFLPPPPPTITLVMPINAYIQNLTTKRRKDSKRHSSNIKALLWRCGRKCSGCHHLLLQWGFLIWKITLMSSFHDFSHVLVVLPNEQTIYFPITLATETQIIETTALINCGATRNFIDIGLLSKANFTLKHLSKPICAYNVDGTANSKETIGWKAHTNILSSNSRESTDLMVFSLE